MTRVGNMAAGRQIGIIPEQHLRTHISSTNTR